VAPLRVSKGSRIGRAVARGSRFVGATIGYVGGAVTDGRGGIGRRGAVASGSGGPAAGVSRQGQGSVERVTIKRESVEDPRVLGGSEAWGAGVGLVEVRRMLGLTVGSVIQIGLRGGVLPLVMARTSIPTTPTPFQAQRYSNSYLYTFLNSLLSLKGILMHKPETIYDRITVVLFPNVMALALFFAIAGTL
jgi:hypothetical protein